MLSTRFSLLKNNWLLFVQSLLFSPVCINCASSSDAAVCEKCQQLAANDKPYRCRQCALTLNTRETLLCGDCLKSPPPFTRTITAFAYSSPWSELIVGFKDQRRLVNGRVLSALLANQIHAQYKGTPLPDIILPVPLHASRMRKRGYNQSLELARNLSGKLGLPLYKRLLQCSRKTVNQKYLGRAARQKNLKNAYRTGPMTHKVLSGRVVALVDDVMTTGATATTLASLLLEQGAAQVHVWVLARTDRH